MLLASLCRDLHTRSLPPVFSSSFKARILSSLVYDFRGEFRDMCGECLAIKAARFPDHYGTMMLPCIASASASAPLRFKLPLEVQGSHHKTVPEKRQLHMIHDSTISKPIPCHDFCTGFLLLWSPIIDS
jgi:hypothetical protein